MQRLDICAFLFDMEDIVRKLITKLTYSRNTAEQEQKNVSAPSEERDDDLDDSFNQGLPKRIGYQADDNISDNSGKSVEDEFQPHGNNKVHPMKTGGISKELTSKFSKVDMEQALQGIRHITTDEQIKMIKELMMKKGAKIAMNVLKIALNK